MEQSKRKRLEAHGWKFGNAQDFLELGDEEVEYIEVKLALSGKVRQRRQARGWTQEQAAEVTGSSQSRVAKMEAGDPSVSIDLLVKTLIAMGATRAELAEAIGSESLTAV